MKSTTARGCTAHVPRVVQQVYETQIDPHCEDAFFIRLAVGLRQQVGVVERGLRGRPGRSKRDVGPCDRGWLVNEFSWSAGYD